MRPARLSAFALTAALVLVVTACGGGQSPEGPAADADGAGAAGEQDAPAPETPADGADGTDTPAGTPEQGPDTPASAAPLQFTAPALSGGQIDGTDYAGEDVVLWMWAPW